MNPIKFSIITVCFNAEKSILRTIRSVLEQKYPYVEYIIIDGASTDKTIEIINRHIDRIGKFISEKDKGIYDAMNKGVGLSTGDVLYFLNADDSFCNENVLARIANIFNEDEERMIVCGNVRPENVPDHIVPYLNKNFQYKSAYQFLSRPLCHQSVFTKKSLFNDIGNFDCRYKYAADNDWLIRAMKYKPNAFYYEDIDIADYFFMGRSYLQSSQAREEMAWIRIRQLFSPFSVYFLRYVLFRALKKKLFNEKW